VRAEGEETVEHRASKVIDFNKGLKYSLFFLKIIHEFNNYEQHRSELATRLTLNGHSETS